MLPHFIYALCEPGSGHVRYIGTAKNPKSRLRTHEKSGTAVGEWIRGLHAVGKKPLMVLVAEIKRPTLDEFPRLSPFDPMHHWVALAAERYCIERYHTYHPGELLNLQHKPATPKKRHVRDHDGVFLDGQTYDQWLPEFREMVAPPRREASDV